MPLHPKIPIAHGTIDHRRLFAIALQSTQHHPRRANARLTLHLERDVRGVW
jgi:hypothetical protein